MNLATVLVSFAIAVVSAEVLMRTSLIPVRNVGPSFTVFDSHYGQRLKADFSATRTTPEFTMRLSTNSLGFRGAEPVRFPSRSIVFLGDSFTLGYGVSDGEEYPSIVAGALKEMVQGRRVPVVNAGIGDSGNGRWVKFLRSDVDKFSPRLIVLQVMENDFRDNLKEKLFVLTRSGDTLREIPPEMPSKRRLQAAIEAVPGLADTYLMGKLREIRLPRLSSPPPNQTPTDANPEPQSEDRDRLTYRLIEEALDICKVKGFPVLVLGVGVDGTRREKLEDLVAHYQNDFRSIPLKTERPDLYFEIDGHWNTSGHKFAAEVVLGFIQAHESLIDDSLNDA